MVESPDEFGPLGHPLKVNRLLFDLSTADTKPGVSRKTPQVVSENSYPFDYQHVSNVCNKNRYFCPKCHGVGGFNKYEKDARQIG